MELFQRLRQFEQPGEYVTIRKAKVCVNRTNPNVVAVSSIVTEKKDDPREYIVTRVLTFWNQQQSVFVTRSEPEKYFPAPRGPRQGDPQTLTASTLSGARFNHAKLLQTIKDRVKNPAYQVLEPEHYTSAETWDQKRADEYNSLTSF